MDGIGFSECREGCSTDYIGGHEYRDEDLAKGFDEVYPEPNGYAFPYRQFWVIDRPLGKRRW